MGRSCIIQIGKNADALFPLGALLDSNDAYLLFLFAQNSGVALSQKTFEHKPVHDFGRVGHSYVKPRFVQWAFQAQCSAFK